MSQPQLPPQTPNETWEGGPLGVMDAMGMGWRLMMSDFWPLWLVAFVFTAINFGIGLFGSIPYLGACIALAAAIFVRPQLGAGLFLAVRQRVDGAAAEVRNVFEGFRLRYWQSVVAMLPLVLAGVGFGIVASIVALSGGILAGQEPGSEEVVVPVLIIVGILLLVGLVVFSLFFIFALLAVWDHPESGWEAAKASMRLVKDHFGSALGLGVLFALISLGAILAGLIAFCIGILFTMPIVTVWFCATTVYLYRSWRGEPLQQEPVRPDGFPDQGWEGPGPAPGGPPAAPPALP